jgi:hypothetical protein
VADAGDVNGDGYADIIVGAHSSDDSNRFTGKVYAYYGSDSGFSLTPDWTAIGENAGDYFGYSVAKAGDVNGDGYTDVIVGAFRNDEGGVDAGKVYLYYGSDAGLSLTPDWTAIGESDYHFFGYSVAGAGDVNKDGYADIIIGALSDKVLAYYGSNSGLSSVPDWTVVGENTGDYFGYSLAEAGDVNNDGYSDIIVGAIFNDDGSTSAGKAYAYHGGDGGLSLIPAWTAVGEGASDYFGNSVAGTGDMNGDGYADVIVGAYHNNDGGSAAGKVYVYYGSDEGLSPTPDWTTVGENAGDEFGYSVAGAGDVNGNGYTDIVIGAWKSDDGGSDAGKIYVYYGSNSNPGSVPDWTTVGENADDRFGSRVLSRAGGLNNDRYLGIIAGAYLNDDGGTNSGKAYVYLAPKPVEWTVCPAGPPTCDYVVIQDAVDAASDGDVIKIATGLYTDVNNHGGLAQVVYISKTLTIHGGYTIANWNTPDPEANPSTLDAEGQGRVLHITGNISPTVEGLHITGGDSDITSGGGGGIRIVDATALISNNWIYSNTASSGGGVYVRTSNATLDGNTTHSVCPIAV